MTIRADNGRWAAELQVRFFQSLRSKIEALTDDEEVIRDTIEGAIDVDPVMETMIGLRQEARAMAASRRALAKTYQEAAQADEVKAEKIETLILEALQAAGQDKWKGIAGTASIRQGSLSCEITDPALIPLQFMKPVPDVARIKQALMNGRAGPDPQDRLLAISGARLVRGEDTLAIRLPNGKKVETAHDQV